MARHFRRKRFRGRVIKEDPHNINRKIKAPVLRVVGDNIKPDIYQLNDALKMAEELGLDLVEISPKANPPVCKIIDYKKFLYDKKKKEKEAKANSVKVVVKEIRLGPNIDDHDFNFKLKHAINFLEDGNKVKVDVFFRGRAIIYKEKGEIVLLRFANELEEYAVVERMPKLEGKRMIMILTPKKKKK